MTYTKVGPFINDALPALNATNLNKMDQGIADGSPIDTIADLKATPGVSNGEVRIVLGYSDILDGGGGIMRRNTSLSTFNEGYTFDMTGAAVAEAGGWDRVSDGRPLSLLQFGARPTNSSTDAATNNTAIANAISALPSSGGIIDAPGNYGISSPITIAKPVRILGRGAASTQGLTSPWNPASSFKWFGSSGANMLQVNGPISGVGLESISFDGNSALAARALSLDAMQMSVIKDVSVRNLSGNAMRMYVSGSAADDGCQLNHIENFRATEVGSLLRMEANAGNTANTCHNTFIGLMGVASAPTAHGMQLVNCDNNTFVRTFMYWPGVGIYSLEFQEWGRQNYFYHFQGKVISRTPNAADPDQSNAIWGLDRSNGQAAPVIESGAHLTWTEDGSIGDGWTFPTRRTFAKGPTPTVAQGSGAGTSPTLNIGGRDNIGLVSVGTGTGTLATSSVVVTITFAEAWRTNPVIILQPANAAAAALTGPKKVFVNDVDVTTTTFAIRSNTTGLDPSTTYRWNWQAIARNYE